MAGTRDNITQLLNNWSPGEDEDQLFTLVYQELHAISRGQIHNTPNLSLQATELLSEAYQRLRQQQVKHWHNRSHFYAIAATVIRRVLLDHARYRNAQQRDRQLQRPLNAEDEVLMSPGRASELLQLDEALDQLAKLDPRQAHMVELRYFGGLSIAETATLLKVSAATIKRDWQLAKAWLYNYIER